MKKLRILFVCILFVSQIIAQGGNALDPEADALLKAVTAKYQKYTSAKIDLKLTIDLPEVDENQVLDVKAWIKGDKFKVELKDQIFVSDNVTLWNYLKEYNEVQINDYEESDAIFSPSILFNLYTKDYVYRVKEEYKNTAGILVKIIELTPIKKDQDFFKIELKIDKANVSILEAKIFERSGMRYTYAISALTPNVPLSDDFFKFNPSLYKGIEIIDARF